MTSSSLEVPRRRQPEKRSRLWRVVVVLATLAVAVGWLVWFLRTPDDLPTSGEAAEGSGVVDQVVYVGMFAVGDDFDRTLRVSDVSVEVDPDDGVEVTPMICRGGSLSVTTDVDAFCPGLDEPDGADFSDGDSIVLAVTASAPTEVEIGRIELSFRDGIRWGTKEAGLEGASLSFLDHTPGTVEDDTAPEDSTTERPDQDDGSDEEKKSGKKDRKKNGKAGDA
jgi:hypothetical protein